MSAFDEIMNATSNRRGNRPNKGKYRGRILKMIEKKGYKGHSFIVEAQILKATKTDPVEDPSPVGSTVSFVLKLSGEGAKGDAAKGNAKDIVTCLFACLGYGAADIAKPVKNPDGSIKYPNQYDRALAEGTMRGVEAEFESFVTQIQTGPRAGQDFVGFNWNPLKQTKEDVLKARAEMDGKQAEVKTVVEPKSDSGNVATQNSADLDAILGL